MIEIHVKTIRPDQHRYPTHGDYFTDDRGVEQIRVSDMGDHKLELCIAIHEIVESYLCKDAGIPEEAITAFDLKFEDELALGLHGPDDEPGDQPDCPYSEQHRKAMIVEHLIANFLGVKRYGVIR